MKLGHVIEHDTRYISIEKPYSKYGGGTSPRPFYTKSKFSGSTVCNNIKFVFMVCSSWGLPKYIQFKFLMTYFYLI